MDRELIAEGDQSELAGGQESVVKIRPWQALLAILLANNPSPSRAFTFGPGAPRTGLNHGLSNESLGVSRGPVIDGTPASNRDDSVFNAVSADLKPSHIVSRGAALRMQEMDSPVSDEVPTEPSSKKGTMPLTRENVELVLEDMRPYLLADGGDVVVRGIRKGVVQLEFQGACVSCPSSAMTMQMGLRRGLRERIPEIVEVEQVVADGAQLTEEGVESVLDEIQQILKAAGTTVELVSLDDGIQSTVTLAISGSGGTINSLRSEITARLKWKIPTLYNVKWIVDAPSRHPGGVQEQPETSRQHPEGEYPRGLKRLMSNLFKKLKNPPLK